MLKEVTPLYCSTLFCLPFVEGLSLLGAYEDSDDEDGDSHGSTVKPQLNQSNDIDSTLANFMAVSIICCVLFACCDHLILN